MSWEIGGNHKIAPVILGQMRANSMDCTIQISEVRLFHVLFFHVPFRIIPLYNTKKEEQIMKYSFPAEENAATFTSHRNTDVREILKRIAGAHR